MNSCIGEAYGGGMVHACHESIGEMEHPLSPLFTQYANQVHVY
jgi:hypothetical protein